MEGRIGAVCLCASASLFYVTYYLAFQVSANAEGDALNALRTNLNDPNNVLQSWDPKLSNPCTWFRITCNSENSVTRVDLGNVNLTGQLVPQLGQLSNLQYLALYGNNITGTIPDELGNLTNLVSLDLYSNDLNGPIPATLGKLQKLRFLRLNNNSLSGPIPMSLTTIGSLQILDLSNNKLTGDIPSFSLSIPISISFQNNLLNGLPVSPPPHVTTTSPAPSIGNSVTGAISGGVAAGAALLFAAPAIAFACWRKGKAQDYFDLPAEEDLGVNFGVIKRFSLHELLVATDNFSQLNILGEGGFGKVYKGRLADGSQVAVKRLCRSSLRQGIREFEAEVGIIGMAVHRNVISLRGVCVTPGERLLVYPFMSNGSVASWLRGRPESQPPLNWPIRKQIALGAARGLAYLHDHCDPKIIHLDVKPSNILLTKEFEAVISDFGLAKLMDYKDTHLTTNVRGTYGFLAPEYAITGKCSEKADVYGYGFSLVELITGKNIHDLCKDGVLPLDWVKGLLKDRKLETLVDSNLQGKYVEDEAEQLIQLAVLCTQSSPMERPKMSEVVRMLEGDGLEERWEEWQKDEVIRQEHSHVNQPSTDYGADCIVDSTSLSSHLTSDELSGPR